MESPKRQAQKLLVNVAELLAMAAKRARRLPRKLKAAASAAGKEEWRMELRLPKKVLRGISEKTVPFIQKQMQQKKKKKKKGEGEEWGQGGVWQKAILMGDKCEPLDFSGVIYYDSNGKQLNHMPLKSPRASPLPPAFYSPFAPHSYHH
ncbi:hypothetical protein Fmac_008561 [Flemingia macrophylla]|uniref:Uncharacterized protein n=1 Tax=Flemingia macrophylla TaxID=520843 RepID=A0ABD1MY98_9FABA